MDTLQKKNSEAAIKHSLRGKLLSKSVTFLITIGFIVTTIYICYLVMNFFDPTMEVKIPVFAISVMLSIVYCLLIAMSGISLFNPCRVIKSPTYKECVKWTTYRKKELERKISEADEKLKKIEAEQKELSSELILLQ